MDSPLIASDFSGLAWVMLGTLAVFCAAALGLALVTSAVLACAYRSWRPWLLTPIFTILWFAAIFGAWQIWLNYLSEDARRYRNWKPERPTHVVPPPLPAPEGVQPEREPVPG